MLKIPVTIFLILLVSLQTFSKWCLIIEFQVNRDYIARNLCVNRAKPSCCCKGKCYIDKRIAGDENQQQAPGKSAQREESPLQLFDEINRIPAPFAAFTAITHFSRYIDPHTQDLYHSIFQPPQA